MDIERLEEFYEGLLEDVGSAENCNPLDTKLEQELQKSLPNELIYIWKKYGLCSYGDGIWWHTNPRDYDDIVEMWLKGTPYWQPKTNLYHVIGRTAFGELYLWGGKSGRNIKISPLNGMIFPVPSYEEDIKSGDTENLICVFVDGGDKTSYDTYDQNSKKLFNRVLKKLGSLKWDEMYTSVPMPVFSGGITLENAQKENIFMQLALLRDSIDMPEIMLNPMMDYDE